MSATDAGNIPGPKGQFLIGNSLAFDRDPITWLRTARDEFGDVVRLAFDTVVVQHPADARTVLSATNSSFAMDKVPFRRTSSQARDHEARMRIWLQENNHVWRTFSRSTVATHLDRITDRLSSLLGEADSEGDVFTAARRICGYTTTDFLLGRSDLADDVAGAASDIAAAEVDLNEHPESRFAFTPKRRSRYIYARSAQLHEAIRSEVEARRSGDRPEDGIRDALDTILAEFPDLDASIIATVLRDTAGAGFSAPGTALTWLMLRLAHHPECAQRIREETGDDPGCPPEKMGELSSSYTGAFVKEVLRLHPPHWLLARRTAKEVVVGDYRIPPRYTILSVPYLLHRDPRWWQDPDTFDPQRWLRPGVPYTDGAYLPFGSGPRMCPGRVAGETQMILTARMLATNYTLRLPELDDVQVGYRSLMRPQNLQGSWQQCPHNAASQS